MTPTPTSLAPHVLDRTRQLVEPALKDAVSRLQPQLAAIAEFHFGWADQHGQQLPNGGGKGVRSALAVLSAESVGAPSEVAVPGAVAVELVHNFSLLHDDIIDGDLQRRHRPAVWALFGQDKAIIAGDALHTLAFEVLLGWGFGDENTLPPAASAISSSEAAACRTQGVFLASVRLASATAAMISGQICDMSFNDRLDVSLQESLDMEAQKTGALLGYAASVGAVLAEAPPEVVAGLERYGQQLGLAFQAADDLLGIWGNPEVTGKPAGNDLREKKKSLPVAYALAQGTAESAELGELLACETLDESQVERATGLIEQVGGRHWVQQAANDYLQASHDCLESVVLDAQAKAELAGLANFVVARDH